MLVNPFNLSSLIRYANGDYTTIAAKRVPDLFIDRKRKTREVILESRPLAAPQNYAPWVYAPNVVN